MPPVHKMSLIERRHQQTRADIAAAAIPLFGEHGYGPTTMDDVAAAAGVSRRTAYRHFPQKADLLFHHAQMWLDRFDEVIADRQPGESTRDVCRRGLLAVAAWIQANREAILAAYAIVRAEESLRGRLGKTQDEWADRYVGLIGPDVAHLRDGKLVAATVAGTLVGCTNALVGVWSVEQPDADMPSMTASVLERMDPMWPAETR